MNQMNKYKYKKPIYAIREDSDESDSNNSDNQGEKKQLWCICRSEDGARFMICCDSCEEWYHGDCVNITPKQSELISKYFCAQCQKRDSSLKIQYKGGIAKRPKEPQLSSKTDKPYKIKPEERMIDQAQSKYDRPYKMKNDDRFGEAIHSKMDKQYKMKIEEKAEKQFKIKSDEKFFDSMQSKYEKTIKPKTDEFKSTDPAPGFRVEKSKIKTEEKLTDSQIKFSQKPLKPGNCGECMGCLRKIDCSSCVNCKTKSEKGCLKRVCNQLSKSTVIDKSIASTTAVKAEKLMLTKLPGEFIPAKTSLPKKPPIPPRVQQQTFSKATLPSSSSPSSNENLHSNQNSQSIPKSSLKRPLSPSSSSESSSIVSSTRPNKTTSTSNNTSSHNNYPSSNKLVTKKPKLEMSDSLPSSKPMSGSKTKDLQSSESSNGDNLNENDEMEEEDDDDDEENDEENDETNDSDDSDNEENDEEEENYQSSGSFVLRKSVKMSGKADQKVVKKAKTSQPSFLERNQRSVSPYSRMKLPRRTARSAMSEAVKDFKPNECHNVGCMKHSRQGSKYCSDECGVNLAEQRLLKYLPNRISNWSNSPSVCNQRDRKTQAEIQEECETIHYNLNILDKSHHDLVEFIDRWRSSYSASNTTDDDDRRMPGANDDSVQCVTCGYMVGSLKALAHMENCYQKIEGGTMVFADFEEQPIGTKLFCDYYDNNIRGYCKRLAALCDHNKDPKVDPKTICAFPLSVNEKSSKVCMTAKIKCNRHVNWERIQRAVIDMNRYRLLVRYEELQVEDRKYKHSIAQRGGVMSLLLHETIDHQPMKPLLPNKGKESRNKMRKFTKPMCI